MTTSMKDFGLTPHERGDNKTGGHSRGENNKTGDVDKRRKNSGSYPLSTSSERPFSARTHAVEWWGCWVFVGVGSGEIHKFYMETPILIEAHLLKWELLTNGHQQWFVCGKLLSSSYILGEIFL